MTPTVPTPARRARRLRVGAAVLLAGGVAAGAVPVPTALADTTDPAGTVAYGGYSGSASSTPVLVEIFEPSVPIPVDAGQPQLELQFGYSKVKADSGQATGRASFLWPGDPVGSGLKTFADQLGFPANPLTDGGYPIQVNSQFPGEQSTEKDATFPGSVMQTTSGEGSAIAEAGFSPDGAVAGPDPDRRSDGGGDGGALPSNPLTDLLGQLGGLGGGQAKTADTAPANPLAMLVDVDGYVSVSRFDTADGKVIARTRSSLGDVRLLGGLITLGGVETTARTTTDGVRGTADGRVRWGTLTIAGQEFSVGPDGVSAAGSTTSLPGLQDVPLDLLEQLGVSLTVPEPVRTVEGDQASALLGGLQITLDTTTLAPVLRALPTGILAELVPAEAGPLKGVVAGLSSLAPKVVVTVGSARATVDTVPPVDAPTPPAETQPEAPVDPTEPTAQGPTAGSPGSTGPAAGPAAPGGGPAPEAAGVAPTAAPLDATTTSGLPALFSIPGMLLIAAFAVAAVAGTWFRRLGAAALGLGGPCSHGLDSGLPDLRKA